MAKKLVPRSQLQGMTKKERQRYVRELRRAEQQRLAQQRRQCRILGWSVAGAAGVGVVALGAVLAVGAVNAVAAGSPSATPAATVGPANMLSDGLHFTGDGSAATATRTAALTEGETPTATASTLTTTGALDVQVYLDPTNTNAATLWTAIGSALEASTAAGTVTLELHPVALTTDDVDAVSAVAAFGCVADTLPDQGLTVWDAMLNRTATSGLTAMDVPTVVQTALTNAGADADAVTACMSAGTFTNWADEASLRAAASIPYTSATVDLSQGAVVTAGGSVYTGALGDAAAFQTFLIDAYTAAGG